MKDYIKQLESKVKDCKNTNTIFDTRKYVLLEDAKEILNKALTIPVVVGQSEQLKCVKCGSFNIAWTLCKDCGHEHLNI